MERKPYGESFKNDIRIDRFQLDVEVEKQPSLMQFYSESLAEAKAMKDEAKNKLEFVLASRDLYYRANPIEGIKVTESSIASMVTTDAEVVQAKEREQQAKERTYFLESAVATIEDRKSELKNLTSLWIGGYYALPGAERTDRSALLRNNLLNGREE